MTEVLANPTMVITLQYTNLWNQHFVGAKSTMLYVNYISIKMKTHVRKMVKCATSMLLWVECYLSE